MSSETGKGSRLEIDELDLMLVKELEFDARLSNLEMASRLNTSPSTVNRRIKNLLDEDVITFVAITDPLTLGFKVRALIGIEVGPGKAQNVADHLVPCPNVRTITLTTGKFDILLSTMFFDEEELIHFLGEELGGHPEVVYAEVMTALKIRKSSWMYVGGDTHVAREAVCRDLDESELRLIKELELQPQESIINLSRKLGMSRISVGRKLQALLEENIVKIVSVARPSVFGLSTQAGVLLRVRPGRLEAVVDILIADRRVNHVVMTAGGYNLFLWVVLRNSRELSHFLANELEAVPGVVGYELVLPVTLRKRAFGLLN